MSNFTFSFGDVVLVNHPNQLYSGRGTISKGKGDLYRISGRDEWIDKKYLMLLYRRDDKKKYLIESLNKRIKNLKDDLTRAENELIELSKFS